MFASITIDHVSGTDLDRCIPDLARLHTTFTWQEIGEPATSPKPMVYWLKPATAHRAAVEGAALAPGPS